jgi:hypothetical protein
LHALPGGSTGSGCEELAGELGGTANVDERSGAAGDRVDDVREEEDTA